MQKDWQQLERLIAGRFPGASATRASGQTWGDGDLTGPGISSEIGTTLSIEAKDQKRAVLDSWWSSTRRQALRYQKEPVLVVRRPPAQLDMGRAVRDEILAVCTFEYFASLHERIAELETELSRREE